MTAITWTNAEGRELATPVEHLHLCVLTGDLIVGVTGHHMRRAAPEELAEVSSVLPAVAAALDAIPLRQSQLTAVSSARSNPRRPNPSSA
jgi:hypothetical protein